MVAGWVGGGAKVRRGELQGEDGMKRKKGLWKKQKKRTAWETERRKEGLDSKIVSGADDWQRTEVEQNI